MRSSRGRFPTLLLAFVRNGDLAGFQYQHGRSALLSQSRVGGLRIPSHKISNGGAIPVEWFLLVAILATAPLFPVCALAYLAFATWRRVARDVKRGPRVIANS